MQQIKTAERPLVQETEAALLSRLTDVLEQRLLSALFQPVVDFEGGRIVGYEGLIRGPSDSPLHSPLMLLRVAAQHGLGLAVEQLCRRVVIDAFVARRLSGLLFLNVRPEALMQRGWRRGETLAYLREAGLASERVVIELTENQPVGDYEPFRQALHHYREMGLQVAIDDLGEGFSGLRLWSELRPDFVKIDMHFVQGIDRDPLKQQFVHSIWEIARSAGTQVIAEGIESAAELATVRAIGIPSGQGYLFARPAAAPPACLTPELAALLGGAGERAGRPRTVTAGHLCRPVPTVGPESASQRVYELFMQHQEVPAIPVLKGDRPIGLITRADLFARLARPFRRELDSRKACAQVMDPAPMLVDEGISIQALGTLIADAEHHHLASGFIVTREGRYVGYGTGQGLMRAITALQIQAARHANPLTELPGNVPINDCIDEWLEAQLPFVVVYADLDHFKPFNDVYGYARGDDAIRLVADLLRAHMHPELDFIGHVGGDDFMLLLRADGWEARCRGLLEAFAERAQALFPPEVRAEGSYPAEDRQGRRTRVPLLSLSLGAVRIEPGILKSHHQVSAAAAAAKKEAKKAAGNSLFVERRGTEGELQGRSPLA